MPNSNSSGADNLVAIQHLEFFRGLMTIIFVSVVAVGAIMDFTKAF